MSRIAPLMMSLLLLLINISCGNHNSTPHGSGMVEATDVLVSAETAGRVLKLNFDEGDRIENGQTLALIDTSTISLRLRRSSALRLAADTKKASAAIESDKADLDANLAEKEFSRIANLIKTGSANRQQYDRAENIYNQAQLARKTAEVALQAAKADLDRIDADIALLEKQLADCRPGAPLAGTIVTKYVQVGELVGIGHSLFKIARLDTVWVKIYLPPQDLAKFKLGDKADVDPEDGREQPLEGTVVWISSEAEFTPKNVQTKEARADLVYAVKVSIPNIDGTLKIGMPVSVSIP